MKIGLAQINTKVGDLKGNTDLILENIDKASERDVNLLVFPELTITGYPPKDLLDFKSFVEDIPTQLERIKEYSKYRDIGIICGYIDFNTKPNGNRFYNAAIFIYKGEIIGKHYKSLLPFYDVFDETRYFEPGDKFEPIEFMGKKIGITICEEIWNDTKTTDLNLYTHNPIAEYANKKIDVLINISASPYQINKEKQRFSVISNLAAKYKIPIVYVNLIGGNDDLLFDGTSFVADSIGAIRTRCSDFREDFEVYDLDKNSGELHNLSDTEEKSLFKALRLGLKDYCQKQGFRKIIIGLSGGIDSAMTAVIASNAIGSQNVLGITMPSMYSSPGSVEDSKKLAKTLNITFYEIPITNVFNSYIQTIQGNQGVSMDLAEENLQARIRANILMMYSNRYGHLLLSTGNKSEMAVGYCTLYGDMAGGLNVLSDVPKMMVYKLAKFINKDREIIPNNIITKPPSAELRPNQKDQDSLPEYEILDEIIKLYVEDNIDPAQIAKKYPKEIVEDIINKINKNEYKRKQATLGFKVSKRAFGSGRRFPIVQGYDFRIK